MNIVTVNTLRATSAAVEQVRASLEAETVPALIALKKELLERLTLRFARELEVADL